MEQFPPNSHKARTAADRGPKRVERVTSGDVRRRKQSFSKKSRLAFFDGETARIAIETTIIENVIPGAKDLLIDGVTNMLERTIHGKRWNNRRSPPAGPLGRVAYNSMWPSRGPEPARAAPSAVPLPRSSRMRHAFDEIVIGSRQEAEEVLDRMYDLVSSEGVVSVADLYELTGVQATHTDNKWGWEDLRGASVGRVRGGGYLLELPEPVALT